jgi:hypothetical protein
METGVRGAVRLSNHPPLEQEKLRDAPCAEKEIVEAAPPKLAGSLRISKDSWECALMAGSDSKEGKGFFYRKVEML